MFNLKKNQEAEKVITSLPSLSRKETLILEMLIISRRELYGLEMVKASRGELKRGTIYVTLQRMQEKGFIDSKPEPRPAPEIGIPRRMYWATGLGERVLTAYHASRANMAHGLVPAEG